MSWLSKVGQILVTATKIITGIGPLIPQLPGGALVKIEDTLTRIQNIIVNVELFGQVLGTPGADKLKAATPLVAQMILQSDMMVGKKIDNPALFQEGAQAIADGMAKILNSLKDDVATS